MSNNEFNKPENFHLKHLCRFKDIADFVLESFLLPHTVPMDSCAYVAYVKCVFCTVNTLQPKL